MSVRCTTGHPSMSTSEVLAGCGLPKISLNTGGVARGGCGGHETEDSRPEGRCSRRRTRYQIGWRVVHCPRLGAVVWRTCRLPCPVSFVTNGSWREREDAEGDRRSIGIFRLPAVDARPEREQGQRKIIRGGLVYCLTEQALS